MGVPQTVYIWAFTSIAKPKSPSLIVIVPSRFRHTWKYNHNRFICIHGRLIWYWPQEIWITVYCNALEQSFAWIFWVILMYSQIRQQICVHWSVSYNIYFLHLMTSGWSCEVFREYLTRHFACSWCLHIFGWCQSHFSDLAFTAKAAFSILDILRWYRKTLWQI